MPRSSIFSFDTLRLDQRSLHRGAVTLIVTLGVVAAVEGVLRVDPYPKSLPFQNTRTGTIMDVLSTESGNPPEVVFLGSSQCAYNISPKDAWHAWGLEAPVAGLNVGMAGCNIRTVDEFYSTYQDILNGGMIVFVCAPLGLTGPVVKDAIDNPGGDYLRNRLPVPEQLMMSLHLFRYRRQYRDLRYQYYLLSRRSLEADLDRRLGPDRCGWRPGQGGVLASTDMNQSADGSAQAKQIHINNNPLVWESLSETLRLAQAKGSRVVCLVPPQPPRFDRTVEQPVTMWASFISELESVCRRQDVLLLDHHQLDDFGDDSFFDFTHLKNADARRYSRFLGEQLAEQLGPDILTGD